MRMRQIPTDEDAYMRRPRVRMRNAVPSPWQAGELRAVDIDSNGDKWFFIKHLETGVFDWYQFAEIDEARVTA